MHDKKIDWKANLIKPNELGKFVTHTNEYDSHLPKLHEKFKVNRIEKFRPFMKFPLPPHRKPVHDFLFVIEGNATRGIGLNTYSIGRNTFCFLPAYQILSKESMSENIKGFYGHFSLDLFTDNLFQKEAIAKLSFLRFNTCPFVKIPSEVALYVTNLLNRLEYEFDSGAPNGFGLISSYLLSLFLEILPHVEFPEDLNTNSNTSSNIVQKYKELLEENIYDYQKVSDYASMLSITPNHLNRCVQSTLGTSAREVLFEMLILESKVLLKQTNLSIAEIAFKLGKREASDFSRFFKSKTKLTPKQFRNN